MRWLLVLVVLGGCSIFMRSIERPTADVRGIWVSPGGSTGVTAPLRFPVSNPNPIGLPLQGIDWEFSIGGTRAVTGTVELSQTIPAKGVAPVVTSLTIAARDAIEVGTALARGSRDYQLKAKLRFSTAIGPLAVEVAHHGQLDGAAGIERLLGAR